MKVKLLNEIKKCDNNAQTFKANNKCYCNEEYNYDDYDDDCDDVDGYVYYANDYCDEDFNECDDYDVDEYDDDDYDDYDGNYGEEYEL